MSFFDSIDSRRKTFILAIIVSIVSILLAYFLGGLIPTIVVAISIAFIFLITKNIWVSDSHSASRVWMYSLAIIMAIAISPSSWYPFIKAIIPNLNHWLIEHNWKAIDISYLPDDSPSALILLFVIICIWIVNRSVVDYSAMKKHSEKLDKPKYADDFLKQLVGYGKVLANDLRNIEIETGWNDYRFTPLDAEVEVRDIYDRRQRKVANLLDALKKDKETQMFLIIGDPGSGKSVALRKLANEMLSEIEKTKKIPIYVNLKEWQVNKKWSKENPPTPDALYDFILKNLKDNGDHFTKSFLTEYFDKMYQDGRIFFLLDSFDEIPAVMDVDESDWLIDELSDVMSRFLAGSHDSRGILSSRNFRKPTRKFKTKTVLEIRPFSEKKIEENFKNAMGEISKDLTSQFFKERKDLNAIASNPFMAALTVQYIQENNRQLPNNQADLYKDYIEKRLDSSKELIAEKQLSIQNILDYATAVAYHMFNSTRLGLEVSVKELKTEGLLGFSTEEIDKIIDILVNVKLCRISRNDKKLSFVHRRFNEYFVVRHLLDNPQLIQFNHIPSDSRWRDAYVLYCEVTDETTAKRIANDCWQEVKQMEKMTDMSSSQYLRSLHCLRFLTEAFRGRLSCIVDFQDELTEYVLRQLKESDNMISQKFAFEATGLFKEDKLEKGVIAALKLGNTWIMETAFKACRYLVKPNEFIHNQIMIYVLNLSFEKFFEKKESLEFSLSLTTHFRIAKIMLKLKLIDFFLIFIAMIFLPSNILSDFNNYSIIIGVLFVCFSRWKIGDFLNSTLSTIIILLFSTFLFQNNMFFLFFIFCIATLPLLNIIVLALLIIYKLISLIRQIKFSFDFKFNFKLPHYKFSDIMGTLLTIFIITIVAYLINTISFNKNLKSWLGTLSTIFLVSIIILGLIMQIKNIYKDCKFLYYKNRNFAYLINRLEIAKNISKLNFKFTRKNYIQLLAEHNITPTGEWPEGKLPNFNNDEASILLAQLEMKWLGLER